MSRPRTHLLLVGLGGIAGASLRWLVNESIASTTFPWPTLLVNVLGCAGLAFVMSRVNTTGLLRLLGAGFFGGLTTFSTFSIEIVDLLDRGRPGLAVTYLTASVVLGLVAFVLVRQVATRLEPRP